MKDDLKIIGVLFGSVFTIAGLIIGSVLFFTRNIPSRYIYCGPGWSDICIKSDSRLPEVNGCVSNGTGKICGTYEVKYGQY